LRGRKALAGTIEEFGGRVATVWSELRPTTRRLVERALQPTQAAAASQRSTPFDARSDLELSRLLAALDEGAAEPDAAARKDHRNQLREVADTCAAVLQEKTQSAEVFVQLVARAELQHDYKRIDSLADALSLRFAPSEICELARSQNVVVRALAQEALAQIPTNVLIGILHDPVDSDIAREALQRQARDFGSEQARQIMGVLDQMDLDSEEL
jgi:predicted AAA+ superfamily ATPase